MIIFEVEDSVMPVKRLHKIAHALKASLPERQNGVVTLNFVDEDEIRRLNRMYREKDAVTDVLSFPSGDAKLSGYFGDIIICLEQAKRQAEGDLELELTDLIVHGVLHVLGFDHEKPSDAAVMFPLQDAIVAKAL